MYMCVKMAIISAASNLELVVNERLFNDTCIFPHHEVLSNSQWGDSVK